VRQPHDIARIALGDEHSGRAGDAGLEFEDRKRVRAPDVLAGHPHAHPPVGGGRCVGDRGEPGDVDEFFFPGDEPNHADEDEQSNTLCPASTRGEGVENSRTASLGATSGEGNWPTAGGSPLHLWSGACSLVQDGRPHSQHTCVENLLFSSRTPVTISARHAVQGVFVAENARKLDAALRVAHVRGLVPRDVDGAGVAAAKWALAGHDQLPSLRSGEVWLFGASRVGGSRPPRSHDLTNCSSPTVASPADPVRIKTQRVSHGRPWETREEVESA